MVKNEIVLMLPYSEALCPPLSQRLPLNAILMANMELSCCTCSWRKETTPGWLPGSKHHGCHPVPRCITLCHTIPWHTKPYLYICCRRGSRWWEWSHAPPFTITPPPMVDPVSCFGQRKPKNWRKIKPQCLNEICAIIFLTRNTLWTHVIV